MLRYVRFAERADRNRRALPDAVRRLVTDKLIELAAMPGYPISPDAAVVASAGRGAREASIGAPRRDRVVRIDLGRLNSTGAASEVTSTSYARVLIRGAAAGVHGRR